MMIKFYRDFFDEVGNVKYKVGSTLEGAEVDRFVKQNYADYQEKVVKLDKKASKK